MSSIRRPADSTRRPLARLPRSAGVTLIELMIVVAIVSILAAVALPSYRSYVLRSHRADAQAFLSEVVARQQQFLLDRRSYAVSLTGATSSNGMAMTVPAAIGARYTVTVTADNTAKPPTFTASAAPTALQSADSCGTLTITHQGSKSASGTGSCW